MILRPLHLLRSGLRRLFRLNVLAALSLLLGIGLGGLWVRTMSVGYWIEYHRPPGETVCLTTIPCRLWFFIYLPDTPQGGVRAGRFGWACGSGRWKPGVRDMYLTEMGNWWLGFNVIPYGPVALEEHHAVGVTISLWVPMALTLVLPLIWLRRWRRHARRVRLGLCLQCGYDTRATPDPIGPRLPQCPECGLSSQNPKH